MRYREGGNGGWARVIVIRRSDIRNRAVEGKFIHSEIYRSNAQAFLCMD